MDIGQLQIRKPLLSAFTVNAEYQPELSRPLLSFTSSSSSSVVERALTIDDYTDAAAENLSSFFLRVRAIEFKTRALRDSLQGLQARQAKLHSKYSKSLSNVMDLDMSDLVSQALCIKISLEALEQENEEHRKLEGCEKGSRVDKVRTFVTHRLRHDLSGFLSDLGTLQKKMKESEKEDLRRMLFILKGETASDEELEKMIETGGGQDLIRKAIQEQGFIRAVKEKEEERRQQQQQQKEADADESKRMVQLQEETVQVQIRMDSVMEIEERYESMRRLKESMIALQQTILQVGELVEVQGEELGEIENNVMGSLSFIKAGVRETEEAKVQKDAAASSRSYIVAIAVIVVLVVAAIAIALVFVFVNNSQ